MLRKNNAISQTIHVAQFQRGIQEDSYFPLVASYIFILVVKSSPSHALLSELYASWVIVRIILYIRQQSTHSTFIQYHA